MDKEILKLFPQKAFKLLSIKDSIRIGASVTKSLMDKKNYEEEFLQKQKKWKWDDIHLTESLSPSGHIQNKEDGERILKIYFTQFFMEDLAVHLDFRSDAFCRSEHFLWKPSKLHYKFTPSFIKGVRSLYTGFYLELDDQFEVGLKLLGMIKESMSNDQKKGVKDLFYKHFGEGKNNPVKFSLDHLQESFNAIFSFFLKEDIPLNPEFAVLGINLVTMYLTLQNISTPLDVKAVFLEVHHVYE